jgi:S-adenosylmethionine:tRNA ribosyltransferase-isomerase
LRTSDFDFALPADRIAQRPLDRRDASRLLVLERDTGTIHHRRFTSICELLHPGDLLVLNVTRVVRARLLGTRDSGAPAELLLLRPLGDDRFEAMVKPGGKLKPGRMITIAHDLRAEILDTTQRRTRIVRLHSETPVMEAIERHGHVPLPPYIERSDEPVDAERYQTVYATEPGSAAAPTAGLHFTPPLLKALEERGVQRAEVVLHVGAGTFKPVETEDPSEHVMHEEWYSIPSATVDAVERTKREGRRVWAVGTTSTRALESAAGESGKLVSLEGDTRLFITPGYRFRVVDALITNFHLPRSTLLMLVAAFAGYDNTMRAYAEAIAGNYRFFSYGDAMAIL